MTVRINKQKINLREKLAGVEEKVNFDEVVRGLGENTAPLILNKDGGNVGVGTTNPNSLVEVYSDSGVGNTQLHIHNNNTGNAAVLKLEGGRNTTNGDIYQDVGQVLFANKGNITAGIRSYHQGDGETSNNSFDDGDLRFLTSDHGSSNVLTTRMVIDKDGNVGIGTTDPGAKLDIVNASATTSESYGLSVQGGGNSSSTGYSLRALDVSGNVDFFVRGDGNVGIGTTNPVSGSTAYKLFVNGKMYVLSTVKFEDLSASADVQTNAAKELTTSSDKRLKNDLGDCEYGLNEVLQVQPKKYTWKEGPEDQQPTIGFFAQDVHPIMPEAAPREAIQNEKGEDDYNWGFHSQTIIAALVNATKEQQQLINDLKSRIETLEQQ